MRPVFLCDVHQLHHSGGRYALATMCIGVGHGVAAVFGECRSCL